VTLECEASDAGTALRIDADGQVLGRLGGLGHGVIQRKAEEAVDEFAARIRAAACP
jgi:carbon monoxide dehydrogenase subunit G